MKRASIAVAALIALTLIGCSGTAEEALSEPQNSAQSAPNETPEPLVAEAPAEPSGPDESAFIADFHERRDGMAGESQVTDASDAQLVAAGWEACDMIRDGADIASIRLVDGEQPNGAGVYADSSALMNAALNTLCPELI